MSEEQATAAVLSAEQRKALGVYVDAVRARHGDRLVDILVFGNRARGDAREESDVDLAILLQGAEWDSWGERRDLIDLGYETFIDLGLRIQPWPVRLSEWDEPSKHHNPRLIDAMRCDGCAVRDAA